MAVTQQQIADLAGVPRSTVARILNNYPNVNPETAARVRKIADEMGYIPNRAGSLLQRAKRPIRLGVVIHAAHTTFMKNLISEVETARSMAAQNGAELLVYPIESMDGVMQLKTLEMLEQQGIDGLMLSPTQDPRICNKINDFTERNIPVVTFNTDMPESNRLCYVGQNSYLGGRTCAGLVNLLLGGRGKALVVTGSREIHSLGERMQGFLDEMQEVYQGVEVLPPACCKEDHKIAYEIVYETLCKEKEVGAIYFTTDGPAGACQAIADLGLMGKVHLVCHDMTVSNIRNMQAGCIDFLIDQNARAQATKPIQILLDKIISNINPEKECFYTHIDIRNQYNILSEPIF